MNHIRPVLLLCMPRADVKTAVPQLKRLAVGLSLNCLGLDPMPVHGHLWWAEWHWDMFVSGEFLFALSVAFL